MQHKTLAVSCPPPLLKILETSFESETEMIKYMHVILTFHTIFQWEITEDFDISYLIQFIHELIFFTNYVVKSDLQEVMVRTHYMVCKINWIR